MFRFILRIFHLTIETIYRYRSIHFNKLKLLVTVLWWKINWIEWHPFDYNVKQCWTIMAQIHYLFLILMQQIKNNSTSVILIHYFNAAKSTIHRRLSINNEPNRTEPNRTHRRLFYCSWKSNNRLRMSFSLSFVYACECVFVYNACVTVVNGITQWIDCFCVYVCDS